MPQPSAGRRCSATAHVYTGAITLTQGEQINARVLSGTHLERPEQLDVLREPGPLYPRHGGDVRPAPATAAEIAAGYTVSDTTDPYRISSISKSQNIGTPAFRWRGWNSPTGSTSSSPAVSLAAGALHGRLSPTRPPSPSATARILEAQYGANWQTDRAGSTAAINNGGDEVEARLAQRRRHRGLHLQSSWYPQTAGGGFSLMVPAPPKRFRSWIPAPAGSPAARPAARPAPPTP